MKVALAQLNYHIGNFEANTSKIIATIEESRAKGAALVVFSELAVCGYPPLDFLEFDDFIQRCESAVEKIAEASKGIAVILGAPAVNTAVEGKDLFNAAYFIEDAKIKSIHHKALLPTYDVFDEYRYFEPALSFSTVELKGVKIAITVCEDLWNIDEENKLYRLTPMEELIKEKPSLMVNIAASPFSYRHPGSRTGLLARNAQKYGLPLIYVNQVGAHTELIFDGGSAAYAKDGQKLMVLPHFKEALVMVDTEDFSGKIPEEREEPSKVSLIHDALVLGIKDYFKKMGFAKATLGLSGGIDSAVTLALAVEALGKENVFPVLLPSMYSSDHSINDARALAENLGCKYEVISITKAYDAFTDTLSQQFEGTTYGIAEENLQARARGVILMALSNKFGYILLNTSNKSEMAVGYGTLYGDMCGGISVLGDCYKGEVYELARYINRNKEIIPENSITKAPSAELRPGQKDSDSLPEYDVLDKLLFEYIENKKGPEELVALGFEEPLVKRVLKMVNTNEWKRKQAPPILRVSDKAFGMGRRMPIVGKYLI
jgi:NAD+ synthase (glutamine-hydrolysing)